MLQIGDADSKLNKVKAFVQFIQRTKSALMIAGSDGKGETMITIKFFERARQR